jgi:hypothetical protein
LRIAIVLRDAAATVTIATSTARQRSSAKADGQRLWRFSAAASDELGVSGWHLVSRSRSARRFSPWKRHRDISMLLMHVMGWSTIVPFSRMAEVVFMVFMHN